MKSSGDPDGDVSDGPDVLSLLNQAFNEAWTEIRHNFVDDPAALQTARNKLADALLRAADQEGCRDAERLKTMALRALALGDRKSRQS